MDSLRAAFDAYLQLVASKTEGLRARPQPRRRLAVVLNPESELRQIVESLEEGAEFRELARRTRPAFEELARRTRDVFPDDLYPVEPDKMWSEREAPKIVRHFFRRSGAYLRYLKQTEIDAANLFAKFEGALKQTQMVVQFLAPLEFVSFRKNDENELNCGQFLIKRFSREQLDEVLQTAVNRVFYAAPDTDQLCNYWFLVAEERQSILGSRKRSYASYSRLFDSPPFDGSGDVFGSYQPPPGPIKRALEVLSLFDWERAADWSLRKWGTGEAWGRFRLPFVILTDDALIRPPHAVPDCSHLAVRDGVGLDQDASSRLESFSRDIGSALARCPEAHPRQFFEIAITYLARAFQAEGLLDQIMLHIVAVDALMGEGGGGRKKICDRLARILTETEACQFAVLYKIRNDLVHGNKMVDSLPGVYLLRLRQIARTATRWFAAYLAHPAVRALPTRKQILQVLDGGGGRQWAARLLAALPPEFPKVTEWTN